MELQIKGGRGERFSESLEFFVNFIRDNSAVVTSLEKHPTLLKDEEWVQMREYLKGSFEIQSMQRTSSEEKPFLLSEEDRRILKLYDLASQIVLHL